MNHNIEVVLFVKDNCQKCQWVKDKLPEDHNIKILNVEEVNGMAEAAYYELIEKLQDSLPILVINNNVIETSIKIKEALKQGGYILWKEY